MHPSVFALVVFVLALACTTRGRAAAPAGSLSEIARRAVAAPGSISAAPLLLVVGAILSVGQQIYPCLLPPLFSDRKQHCKPLTILSIAALVVFVLTLAGTA